MGSFDIPSGAAAQVSVIDTGARMHDMLACFLLTPDVDGFEKLAPIASWSFLVQSSTGQKALFDLGIPADVRSCPPLIANQLESFDVKLEAQKTVQDKLVQHGVDLSDIGSVVWSHWHWDHVGSITGFPLTTDIVVGPGFKDAYFPGYPTHPESHIHENYMKDRNVREIAFVEAGTIQIGGFRAHDFFGDGSFYLLDTPGHAVGHLAGLARTTTSPDTFILMGGDLGHHRGELRPSSKVAIPHTVNLSTDEAERLHLATPIDGTAFRQLNVKRGRKEDEPFFDPVLADDLSEAIRTLRKAQVADARDDVFVVCAHDMEIVGVIDFYPRAANDWKNKGWKVKTEWTFLADLAVAACADHVVAA